MDHVASALKRATLGLWLPANVASIIMLCAPVSWAADRGHAQSNGRQLWDRIERMVVYKSPRRARYPSIISTDAGDLLLLFTRQTEQQEEGIGDLVLSRSSDGGKTWSVPQAAYQSNGGEPRTIGTMTRLKSGKILAPFEEWADDGTNSALRILSSVDGGRIWSVMEPEVESPFVWLAPSGRVVETRGGEW